MTDPVHDKSSPGEESFRFDETKLADHQSFYINTRAKPEMLLTTREEKPAVRAGAPPAEKFNKCARHGRHYRRRRLQKTISSFRRAADIGRSLLPSAFRLG